MEVNPRMIYALRTERRPLSHAALARIAGGHIDEDLDRLRRRGLVRLTAQGAAWTGS